MKKVLLKLFTLTVFIIILMNTVQNTFYGAENFPMILFFTVGLTLVTVTLGIFIYNRWSKLKSLT